MNDGERTIKNNVNEDKRHFNAELRGNSFQLMQDQ